MKSRRSREETDLEQPAIRRGATRGGTYPGPSTTAVKLSGGSQPIRRLAFARTFPVEESVTSRVMVTGCRSFSPCSEK
jgi:hypothetical protein